MQLHVTQLSFPHFPVQVQEVYQAGKGHLERKETTPNCNLKQQMLMQSKIGCFIDLKILKENTPICSNSDV